tara:strand:+ start:52 stop:483 length:432 start_codon:yes stop_codon:yes gene_type:complete
MGYIKRFESVVNSFDILSSKLLSFGGSSVKSVHEEDLDELVNSGLLYDISDGFMGYELLKMDVSKCHKNVVTFYSNFINDSDNSYDELSIVTGWALSNDGVWYQHSWLYFNYDDVILETTESRLLYYGVILSGVALDNFIESN